MFGKTIRKHRRLVEMSQAELAEKVGVSRQTINRIENGYSYPSGPLLEKLMQVFNLRLPDPDLSDTLNEVSEVR